MRGIVYIALGMFLVGFAGYVFKFEMALKADRASQEMAKKTDLAPHQLGPAR